MPDSTSTMIQDLSKLLVLDMGRTAYSRGLELQHQFHAKVSRGKQSPTLILTEHEPVITLGKNAPRNDILVPEEQLQAMGVSIEQTTRGGKVTSHGPGQVVAYPILPLTDLRMTVRSLVCSLEQGVIACLNDFGIEGATDAQNPGVWVGQDKICAIGIRVTQRTSMHGIALNVASQSSISHFIRPCGIAGRGTTSFAELGVLVNRRQVIECLVSHLAQRWGLTPVKSRSQSAGTTTSQGLQPGHCKNL